MLILKGGGGLWLEIFLGLAKDALGDAAVMMLAIGENFGGRLDGRDLVQEIVETEVAVLRPQSSIEDFRRVLRVAAAGRAGRRTP